MKMMTDFIYVDEFYKKIIKFLLFLDLCYYNSKFISFLKLLPKKKFLLVLHIYYIYIFIILEFI